VKIELNCGKCGSNRFDYPIKLTDETMILCAECGHTIGTVVQLQQKLIDELERRSAR
jgi:hypothetical protein